MTQSRRFPIKSAALLLVFLSLASGLVTFLALRNSDKSHGPQVAIELRDARERFLAEQLAARLPQPEEALLLNVAATLEASAEARVHSAFDGVAGVLTGLEQDVAAVHQQLDAIRTSLGELSALTLADAELAYPEISFDPDDESYFYEYGAYLAGECTACHSISYEFTGIPIIFGLEESYFVGRMNDYANGNLDNQAMASVASALDEEMLLSLAIYFKAQEPKDE